MPEILIASLSPIGHIGPLLHVAEGLVARGDRVTVLTSADHADRVRATGATAVAVPAQADFDMTRLDLDLPGRVDTSGIKRVNFDIVRLFLQPMPHQTRALAALFSQTKYDAVLADAGFFGTLPFLLGDRRARPPILMYSTTPLMISSRDTAPFGLGAGPSCSRAGRLRNRLLTAFSQKVLMRESQKVANLLLDELNSRPLPTFLFDAALLADRLIAPTVPQFDYPRSDLPANVRYVGAVHLSASTGFRAPLWWPRLDDDRPVVHVTQGTIDNADPSRLLEPTIAALDEEDVTVVATTGGRPTSQLGCRIPTNTYVAEYVPHDMLLPKVDVMVTNGGFGAVQRALAAGVPLVVAGNTEDKPEVAARVAWAGAGVDLKTGTPTAGAVRAAVREVINNERYRRGARALETAFAQRDGVAEIAALIDEVIYEDRAVAR
ncbi:glycosyltransferase family 1 protein [Mycolicibacterium flavescens]|uniref:Glycosyl transferase n=1 Tax=Mycolicibacterium flavescens TaxID=1776 RepID=A0A1E3RMY4_MYCFV|nr:glycosyltransferase [Mycolicibacterium flavescens]MCV7281220.1 glycosyltransferase family 1 protein [Mycolicibacterium flavescens]ODQ91253.1 glycosyl transferase [Mycolicibacterium flavescens]